MAERVIIMGAAGRDFHNFNVIYRNNPRYQVVAFTAAQIPDIAHRVYPPELAGPGYPHGIPIFPEEELDRLIHRLRADLVVFSYSDVSHLQVMHRASRVTAAGANFMLLAASAAMLNASKPVIAVCSVRTGCGKSQTTRQVCRILRRLGKTVVVVRHPMAYGDLLQQEVQRFVHYDDFARHHCTIEEREEYEPLVEMGVVVYAGVDYGKILARAEAEAEVIIWDGGNNDTPFFRPDLHLVLLDAHRPGHETEYYPGEANLRLADVAIINKVDSAPPENVERLRAAVARLTPQAQVLLAASPLLVCHPERLRGRRVLVVEDAPTLTHGEMLYGAGMVAARTYGVAEVVDPRPFAAGSLRQLYQDYPRLAPVLPAMGYTPQQMQDLEATINAADCDLVVFATPIKLTKLLRLNKPAFRVRYTYEDVGRPTLEEVIAARMAQWR